MPLIQHPNPSIESLHAEATRRGLKLGVGITPTRTSDELNDHRAKTGNWPDPPSLVVMVTSGPVIVLREIVRDRLEDTAQLVLTQLRVLPK